jgi:serine/threonine protein kinase
LTYELLTGTAPFSPLENQNNQDYVDVKTRENITNLRIRFPSDFPSLARDFISKILIKDPTKRAPIASIKTHLWITSNVGTVLTGNNFEKF